eukprot:13441864-Alexandrium_andersonii.AAC.1
MLARVVLLIYILHVNGVMVVLEQPASSLMAYHPRFQRLLRDIPLYCCKEYLGYHLADTAKPVLLYSNMRFVLEIPLYRVRSWLPTSQGVVRNFVDKNG